MKKIVLSVIALVMAACMMIGCTAATTAAPAAEPAKAAETAAAPAAETAAAPAEAAEAAGIVPVKTGYAVTTSAASSKSATADAEGEVKYETDIAAVTIDADGIIRACKIDAIQASVKFDATGNITSDTATLVPTKNEKGPAYGMVAYGGAIAEWNEQIAAFCDYCVGKTVDEIKNGAVDETGKAPAGSELASSATITLVGFVNLVEAAANNAVEMGAVATDTLALATENSLASSKSATAEKAGNAQLDAAIVVLTANGEGVITSCIFDAVQGKVGFDTTGTITSDTNAAIQTKNERGEGYGMVAYGGAIAEWNVQAASFASYITGKTAAEVAGIAVSENHATDADIASSVTIKVNEFMELVAKAFAN